MKISELKAGKITIKNTANFDQSISIYVPNKTDVAYTLPAKQSLVIVTVCAGESFSYLAQAKDDLTVTLEDVDAVK